MGRVNQIKLGRVSNNLISGEHNLIHSTGKINDKSGHEMLGWILNQEKLVARGIFLQILESW